MMKNFKLLVLATALCILPSGCKNTVSTEPSQIATVHPGVGSVYYIANNFKDSTGKIITTEPNTDSVIQINVTYRGYSDVIVFGLDNGNGPEMLRIDADGDIWLPGIPLYHPKGNGTSIQTPPTRTKVIRVRNWVIRRT